MAAYHNNFVVSVIYNGSPVRESNDSGNRVARIPFGSEYSLRIKNKKNCPANVKLYIDGTPVFSGDQALYLAPGETADLERFVDSLRSGNKFKFVSTAEGAATGQMDDPTSPLNGQIRCVFEYDSNYRAPVLTSTWTPGDPLRSIFVNNAISGVIPFSEKGVTAASTVCCAPPHSNVSFTSSIDVGGTVLGGHSNQVFTPVDTQIYTPDRTEIVLWLRGLARDRYAVRISNGRIASISYAGRGIVDNSAFIDTSGLHLTINGFPVLVNDFDVTQ